MPSLLIINPNRTEAVTATLARFAQATADARAAASPTRWTIDATSARFGASYISSETSFAIAAHAALDAYAAWCDRHGAPPDVTLVGCFGDPGVMALREASARPVIGLAEASMRAAAEIGRYAVLTGGQRWRPMLTRLARAEGFDDLLVLIHTVSATGGQMAADPDGAARLLAQACRELTQAHRLDAIVLGGAGLAGMASRLQAQVPVPIIDSVVAGIDLALSQPLVATAADGVVPGEPAAGWDGLSRELGAWLHGKA